MNLFDRILGLKNEHQEVIDAIVSLVEQNESLKKEIEELNEKLATMESDMSLTVEELNKEREKVQNIERLIEEGIERIRDMK